MSIGENVQANIPGPFDGVVEDLQRLRQQAGNVSYADIAFRVSHLREERGVSAAAARVARSTVFDAFKSGRRRMNADLIADIALALGEEAEAAEGWRARCEEIEFNERTMEPTAGRGQVRPIVSPPTPFTLPAAQHPTDQASSQEFPTVTPQVSVHGDLQVAASQDENAAPEAKAAEAPRAPLAPQIPQVPRTPRTPETVTPAAAHPELLKTSLIIMLLIACVGINIFGNTVINKYGLLVFLDMVGTAIAAITLGPWYGVTVAVATNLLTTISGDSVSIWFGLVNVTGALVWGYGYHRLKMSRKPIGFFLLNISAAVACTLVAVPITVLVFDGFAVHASNTLSQTLIAIGQGVWSAAFLGNILASIIDKLISGYLALLAKRLLAPLHLGPKPATADAAVNS